jgi:hypothetical protein
MYIRFAKGQYVDAVIPTAVEEWEPNAGPDDVIWLIPADINPSKSVPETRNVQARDEVTGQPIFGENGAPVWATVVTEGTDGAKVETVVTEEVMVTYKLRQKPSLFTQDDILEALGETQPTVI